MYALKFSHLIKERTDAEVYQMYIDMRCFGKGFEEFYDRLSEEGVKFIRGKVAKVTDRALTEEEQGKLTVSVADAILGGTIRVPVDMVILCIALEPRADSDQVARLFNISKSRDGFFLERHPKLDPIATMSDGVYIVGCCQGPKDIPDTVAQASAGAARILALISRGTLTSDPMVATVDAMRCIGCLLCAEVCPFSAIDSQITADGRTVAVVNESLCKGCGLCVAACRPGAANLHGFTQQQLLAEVMAL
jgi:heterodisulfide reductase subunit A